VVNYECPDSEMTYVHRIGRTGRAGAKGIAVTLVDWADLTRWKVINKTLNLDFPEPPESYSTSPELMADLGIPEGTKGRLKAPEPKEPRERTSDRGSKGHHGHDKERSERPARDRSRRRLRNGVPITEEGVVEASAPVSEPVAEGEASERPARRRRRRRGGSGNGGAAGSSTESTSSED
jgi:superfamily II DNA/RNA helicase